MRLFLPAAFILISIKGYFMLATASTPDVIQSVGYWIAFLLAAGAAAFERYNAQKVRNKSEAEKQVVSEATAWKSRAELFEKMSTDFRALLETERADHQKTRDYWHEKATKFQADLARCNEDCLKLQGRTDITRVENMILEQGRHLSTVAEGIRELLACKS